MKKNFFQRFLLLTAMAVLLLSGCGVGENSSDGKNTKYQSGLSTNTQLSSVNFKPYVPLFPKFDNQTNETREKRVYTASVFNNVDEVTISPYLYDRFSSLTVNGTPIESGEVSEPIALISGENNFIEVDITSESGEAGSYKFTIYRSSDSMDRSLASLEVSEGVLEPTFEESPSGIDGVWSVNVPNEITQITVTPTAADANVTSITVNGEKAKPGTGFPAIVLNEVETEIEINVTAQEATFDTTYYLVVTRGQSSDVTLNNIILSPGNINENMTLVPDGPWTASVGYEVNQVTITPEKGNVGQTITIGVNEPDPLKHESLDQGKKQVPLYEGENKIFIGVTAGDGLTDALYELTITRALNNDSSLSGLVINGTQDTSVSLNGTIDPEGNIDLGTVTIDSASFTLTPSATDSVNAVIRVDSQVVVSGEASSSYSLDEGANRNFPISVTAADGLTTSTYTLNVRRSAPGDSNNTQLSSLTITPGELVADNTIPGEIRYTATVSSDTTLVTVRATKAEVVQTVTITAEDIASTETDTNYTSSVINITQTKTIITVTTVAQNGSDSQVITITVTREFNGNANLASIELLEGELLDSAGDTTLFDADTLTYYVSVSSVSESISFTPTAMRTSISGIVVTKTDVATGVETVVDTGVEPQAQSGNPVIVGGLPTGETAINIEVTADDLTTTKTYTLNVNRPEPANTALASLTVVAGADELLSSTGIDAPWALDVGVSEVTITAVAEDATALVEIQDVTDPTQTPTTITGPLSVFEGVTIVDIVVTTGADSQKYTLTITKAAGGAEPLLSDISIAMGSTTPTNRPLYLNFNSPVYEGDPSVFVPETTEYAAVVYGFKSFSVTATPQSPGEIQSITINGTNVFDSNTGIAERNVSVRSAGMVKAVEIFVTDTSNKTTTYTVEVKVLNIFEFYRIVYRPAMDKAYIPRWESIKPNPLSDRTLDGIISGHLRWWTVSSGNAYNNMQLNSYYDGQYGKDYNDNGVVVDGLTVGLLKNSIVNGYHGYVEGYKGYTLQDPKDANNTMNVEGYSIFLPNETGKGGQGDLVAHLRYQLKVFKKNKIVSPDSWVEVTYMGDIQRFHFRKKDDADCPIVYPPTEPGFDWNNPWTETPCYGDFAEKDPNWGP